MIAREQQKKASSRPGKAFLAENLDQSFAATMAPLEKTNCMMSHEPSFRNNHDKVAFAVHATFLASGYFLTATGPASCKRDALYTSSTVGIDRWNELEEYTSVYAKPACSRGSKKVLVKCLAMNDKLVVDTLKDGADELVVRTEIDVDDFAVDGGGNYLDQYKNLAKLVENLDKEILSKFDPSSR
ncbi:hypothetical protein CDL15_Pgr000615 [Punica granatum]|uniref:PI31 proteasome regulator N-terminal domain-containing protein n=1 Tax=Punica granatum TaxID=22663 RepID=A0A218W3N5_PUNGR|nr:hypothetical protein CDL15_Pgr000615 [Punica granatum]